MTDLKNLARGIREEVRSIEEVRNGASGLEASPQTRRLGREIAARDPEPLRALAARLETDEGTRLRFTEGKVTFDLEVLDGAEVIAVVYGHANLAASELPSEPVKDALRTVLAAGSLDCVEVRVVGPDGWENVRAGEGI